MDYAVEPGTYRRARIMMGLAVTGGHVVFAAVLWFLGLAAFAVLALGVAAASAIGDHHEGASWSKALASAARATAGLAWPAGLFAGLREASGLPLWGSAVCALVMSAALAWCLAPRLGRRLVEYSR